MILGSRAIIQPPLTSCGNGKNIKDRQVVEVRDSLKDFVNVLECLSLYQLFQTGLMFVGKTGTNPIEDPFRYS